MEHVPDSLKRLLDRLGRWGEVLETFSLPAPLAGKIRLSGLQEPVRNLSRRITEGPGAPSRVAFFGPTGVGKSKIFNSILGEVLSPSGYRRPFTRQAVYYLHERFAGIAGELAGDVRQHRRDSWSWCVLVDTPDFDSVEDSNLEIAERIYLEADVLIFVTDIHKYADAATWNYVERLERETKRCCFVINKVGESGPDEDFLERLTETFGGASSSLLLVTVGDYTQGDEALLPASDPGLEALSSYLAEISSEGETPRIEAFRLDLVRFLDAWDALYEPLQIYHRGRAQLEANLEVIYRKHSSRLEALLETRVDPALKEDVYQEMLRRLERIDVLRYPRKILALPVKGARKLLGQYIPRLREEGQRTNGLAKGEDPIQDRSYPMLESVVFDFTEEMLGELRAKPEVVSPFSDETVRALRLSHDEIRQRYRDGTARYHEWATEEAKRTAAALTGEHKLKFLLSQVIYNAVVIGVQIKTFGALSLTELLADGVLSPLVAKAVSMAISSEQVNAFETAAKKRHLSLLTEILDAARAPFDKYLESLQTSGGVVESIGHEVEELRREVDSLSGCFEKWVSSSGEVAEPSRTRNPR